MVDEVIIEVVGIYTIVGFGRKGILNAGMYGQTTTINGPDETPVAASLFAPLSRSAFLIELYRPMKSG